MALRNGTTTAATVMGIKYIGANVSRNNQPSAPHQFLATTSLFHITLLTILLKNPSTAQILSKSCDLLLPQPCGMAAPQSRRTDGWASPPHFHTHAAHRSTTRFRADVQREEE